MTSENSPLLTDSTETTDAINTYTLSPELKSSVKKKLYVSHFLYVWNARVYEFAIVLFIIDLFPGTLLPSSLFSLISSGSVILLTAFVLKLVGKQNSLKAIRGTITIQRGSAILSSSILFIIFSYFQHHQILKLSSLFIVIICGSIERLSTVANKLIISRGWIVKISEYDTQFLVDLNSKLRGIDLFCKLVGPFFISAFLSITSHEITAIFLILSFLISSRVELKAIQNIYDSVPLLKQDIKSIKANTEHKSTSHLQDFKLFIKNQLSLPVLALSIVYFTVLSFGGSTVAYLLTFDDINTLTIGALKFISTVFELFGAIVLFPFLARNLGLINTGLVSVIFQFVSLVPIVVSFHLGYINTYRLICLCIPWSRVGLWCFDLSVQNSIQIYIKDDTVRYNITTFEEMLNNLFELLGYVSTLLFHRPEQFRYPVYATVTAIGISAFVFTVFFIRVKSGKVVLGS